VLAGVLGGLAEKFGWETRPLRLLFGILTFATAGAALIPYLAVWAIARPHGPPRITPRFWRSPTNSVLGGVLGGLSEKWGRSPTVLRAAYVVGTGLTGFIPGILVYLLVWTATPTSDRLHDRR
jgi:phage shock protein PspC (stress-responsive transcriptional regulator)